MQGGAIIAAIIAASQQMNVCDNCKTWFDKVYLVRMCPNQPVNISYVGRQG